LLVKNNLATRGYVNQNGQNIRQIAEEARRSRALAYLENNEIPRQIMQRNSSMDQVITSQTKSGSLRMDAKSPIKPNAKLHNNRKTSIDPSNNTVAKA
jgi:hypothetical protein